MSDKEAIEKINGIIRDMDSPKDKEIADLRRLIFLLDRYIIFPGGHDEIIMLRKKLGPFS